jgi:hypothetical protein
MLLTFVITGNLCTWFKHSPASAAWKKKEIKPARHLWAALLN